jgi:biopolymer transport protein TolQ
MSFNILLRSYMESDPIGKAIFILLFALSIITWVVLLSKAKTFILAKRELKQSRLNSSGPFSILFQEAQKSHPKLEEHLDMIAQIEIKKLEQNLFILQTIVSLAPFVGILGTVWGILISLFEMRHHSSSLGNSAIIAGLSTALGTTVLGLIIAIPALIGYNALKSASRSLYSDMQVFSHNLIHGQVR